MFSGFSSVESEFCEEEKFGIKLALVSIPYVAGKLMNVTKNIYYYTMTF